MWQARSICPLAVTRFSIVQFAVRRPQLAISCGVAGVSSEPLDREGCGSQFLDFRLVIGHRISPPFLHRVVTTVLAEVARMKLCGPTVPRTTNAKCSIQPDPVELRTALRFETIKCPGPQRLSTTFLNIVLLATVGSRLRRVHFSFRRGLDK
jgi:hypothetical protein